MTLASFLASVQAYFLMFLTLISPITNFFGVKPMQTVPITATDDSIVQTVDILSFNILYGGGEHRAKTVREQSVIETIRKQAPDSFGLQEALPEWVDTIAAAFPDYGVVNLGRDGNNEGEANPVFYRKDKYELESSGTFWLSDTPDVLSNTWNASCNRICTWAVLKDKQTGFRYAHVNTHLDVGSAEAREKGAALIVQKIAECIPQDIAVVVTGDFNAKTGEKPYQIMTKNGFYDSAKIANEADKGGTYHNYQLLDLVNFRPIDYIFVSRHVRNAEYYHIVKDKADGMYPSDHYPVAARLTLANQTRAEGVTRIMSFNVLTGGEGEKESTHRVNRVANTIQMVNPDSFGVQEAHFIWMLDLKNKLPQYDYVGVGRDDGMLLGEFSAVFYLKEKYKVVDSGTFWISPTPEKPSIGWDAAIVRVCTWAILENKQTGERYAHYNTHLDHVGTEARVRGVELMRERASGLDVPVVITGDFNVAQDSAPYNTMVQDTFGDAKILAPDTMDGGTFHGYRAPGDKPIDFVFFTKDSVRAVKYRILKDPMLGGLPSDHFPIYADLVIGK